MYYFQRTTHILSRTFLYIEMAVLIQQQQEMHGMLCKHEGGSLALSESHVQDW
jgi:hypothetical protein